MCKSIFYIIEKEYGIFRNHRKYLRKIIRSDEKSTQK